MGGVLRCCRGLLPGGLVFCLVVLAASCSSAVPERDYAGYFLPESEACIEYALGEGSGDLSIYTHVYEVGDREVHFRDVVLHEGEVISEFPYVGRYEDGAVYKSSDDGDVIVWPGTERAGDGWEFDSYLHAGADAEVRGECRLVDQDMNSEEESHDELHILCQVSHRGDTFGHRRVYRHGVGLVKEYPVLETPDGEVVEHLSRTITEIRTDFEACP